MAAAVYNASSPDDVPRVIAEVFGAVARDFDRISYRKPLQETVIPLLQAEHEQYFNNETGPLGKWPALAPSTVARKGFDTVLIETNKMRSSLLFQAPDHVEDIEDRYLTWGTSDEKAAIHQQGAGKIPQRAFVGVSETTCDRIADAIADAVVQAIME